MAETDLEMVERHIREGADHIERQRSLAAELQKDGHGDLAAQARVLLRQFEEIQAQHIVHRDRLRAAG